MTKSRVAVLGAGAWGTALAVLIARNGFPVNLWEFDANNCRAMMRDQMNKQFLPGILLPDSVKIFNDLNASVANVDSVLIAVPSQVYASTLRALKNANEIPPFFAWATKGLVNSGQLLSEITQEILEGTVKPLVLSGPTFAREIAEDLPSAIVAASAQPSLCAHWQRILSNKNLTVHLSDDIIGAQIGGVIKNVLAVAVGLCDGRGYGANARAALMIRGLGEMLHLGLALNAKSETLLSYAGLGDLILTCTDDQSRNRRFGLALGKGLSIAEAHHQIGHVIEGYHNAEQLHCLAKKRNLNLPITEKIYQILFHEAAVDSFFPL